jgi:hypothetical protein
LLREIRSEAVAEFFRPLSNRSPALFTVGVGLYRPTSGGGQPGALIGLGEDYAVSGVLIIMALTGL